MVKKFVLSANAIRYIKKLRRLDSQQDSAINMDDEEAFFELRDKGL